MKKIFKIQSVSDIITNSSSEVYIEKIDDYGLLDKVLDTMGIKSYYTYFKSEDDIKKWFINVITNNWDELELYEDVFIQNKEMSNGNIYPYNISLNYLRSLCDEPSISIAIDYLYEKRDIDSTFIPTFNDDEISNVLSNWKKKTPEDLWEMHKEFFMDKLLGYAVANIDRDVMFELNEKYNKEINKIHYDDSLVHPIDTKDKFYDLYHNIININDCVLMPVINKHNTIEICMAKLNDIKLREDGKYDITFEIYGYDTPKILTIQSDKWITNIIKKIPNEIFGTVMHTPDITNNDIFTAAHVEAGYSKLSSEHLAFEKGAKWMLEQLYDKYDI